MDFLLFYNINSTELQPVYRWNDRFFHAGYSTNMVVVSNIISIFT